MSKEIQTTPEGWLVDRYRLATRPSMGDVFIEYRGNEKWAIKNNPDVLNRFLEWEYEPLPSSRDESFIERTRFNSPEEAANAFKQVTA